MLSESLRIRQVQPPIIPHIARLIAAHPGTISLGQGVVYYPPPIQALEAANAFATENADHRYGAAAGKPELTALLEHKLTTENGMRVNDGNAVMVTAGANMAFLNVMLAITDPGDEIILFRPYYFNQEMAIRMVSAVPVYVPTDRDYQPDLHALAAAITQRTRAIVTVSPNNPSGAVYTRSTLSAINHVCASHDIYHISDEAYEYFTFGSTEHYSPGSLPDASKHTITLFSLSKAYGFASWRIGYMLYPVHLESALLKVQDTNLICASAIAQVAAVGALTAGAPYCRAHIEPIASVRALLLNELSNVSDRLTLTGGEGALYCLVRADTHLTSLEFVERLIKKYGVAVIPGDTFGLDDGCYFRVSFGALKPDTARAGIERLAGGVKRLLD